MMVITSGRDESRLSAVTLSHLEAQNFAIEAECTVEVGDFEMHMAD